MANQTSYSLVRLPIELVYRILDQLCDFDLICSIPNVCLRLNMIIDTYLQYQVKSMRA